MKRKLLALSLVLALVLSFALTGCKPTEKAPTDDNNVTNEDTNTPDDNDAEATDIKVGMVTDEGGVNDQSFNQSAWEGLEQAQQELGVTAKYQESHQEADYAPNFETLLDAGNDLIWGIGYKLADAALAAAEANPDTKYGIIDSAYGDDTPENMVGVLFKAEQPSFLVGYIAGRMTETNKIGFVGGIEGEVIGSFDYGFQAGVQYAAKELGKEITVLSQYADSFSDAAKGKSIATNMYQQGMDVVFHAAGGVGDGVIEAAKEQNKWVIGVDRDQSDMAPDNVLTSAMKRVDIGVYNIVKALKDGNFPGGTTVTYGLADNGAVDIAPTSDKHVPADILTKVEEIKQDIINGKIEVPVNQDTYDVFVEGLK
ncbi:BMP family ABC transporter substrate-binding protein [Tissierella pigra]|uniref:BMP family ABC transporter substrate-binding protein n=1 Tax=Tissierella pigra TaxID=2607614 RepID=A0A6N7XXU0_9FIRM|nr:BMP family ABC transporter substrate-binding protein [Tissierella pigra]MBU5425901.1 BMP family ABC transporter substrate-binding protein [Tissierella pigra]MSU02263.1 BMP family ABC transporter substrate-binding protein [Tissierella pigra]